MADLRETRNEEKEELRELNDRLETYGEQYYRCILCTGHCISAILIVAACWREQPLALDY
jgi:hypothetical protein